MPPHLPVLYPILNADEMTAPHLLAMVRVSVACGCGTVQLRAKNASPKEMVSLAAAVSSAAKAAISDGGFSARLKPCPSEIILILNDRPDIALLAGFDGCHVGQDDLSITGARKILPRPKVLGLSTHNEAQVRAGDESDADYLAIGPVFATASKADAAPVLGLAEFARLRKLTSKPVVAIGGITRENARQVLDAGADSVAMIGDLYRGCTAENFMEQFEENVRDILARIL